jgi:hypothetical protein
MKTRLAKVLIVVGFVLGAWQCSTRPLPVATTPRVGQVAAQVAQFHFTVQRTEAGVKLQCQEGCAWKELSFSLREDNAQAVDAMGMAAK